jgi:hypothetical protein
MQRDGRISRLQRIEEMPVPEIKPVGDREAREHHTDILTVNGQATREEPCFQYSRAVAPNRFRRARDRSGCSARSAADPAVVPSERSVEASNSVHSLFLGHRTGIETGFALPHRNSVIARSEIDEAIQT